MPNCDVHIRNEIPVVVSSSKNDQVVKWDVTLLKDKDCVKRFQNQCSQQLTNCATLRNWSDFVSLITSASNIVLKAPPHTSLTPRRSRALTNLKKTLVKKNRGFATNVEVSESRRELQKQWDRYRNEECAEFFKNVNSFHYSERVKRTCKFIRNYRKKTSRRVVPNIPLTSWFAALQNSSGLKPELIAEVDGVNISPSPTETEINEIICAMKRGKCPGKDRIPIEIFKALPDDVFTELTKIFQRIWLNNDPPKEWQDTVQVPIPKIKQPSTVDDYRRITNTLSSWIQNTLLLDVETFR